MEFNKENLKLELLKYGEDVSVELFDDGNVLEITARNKTGRLSTYSRIRDEMITPYYDKTVVFDFGGGRLKCAFKK